MCESAEFNGPHCLKQCKRCAPAKKPRALRITKEWFEDYEIREGKDGKVGIYLRKFNCRLATFNANTNALQLRLKKFFDHCATPTPKRSTKRKKPRRDYSGPGGGAFMTDCLGDE